MDWLYTAISNVRETQLKVEHQLQRIIRQNDELIALLKQRQKPHIPAPQLDWHKLGPKLWWGLLLAGLIVAKAMDLPEVAAIISKMG